MKRRARQNRGWRLRQGSEALSLLPPIDPLPLLPPTTAHNFVISSFIVFMSSSTIDGASHCVQHNASNYQMINLFSCDRFLLLLSPSILILVLTLRRSQRLHGVRAKDVSIYYFSQRHSRPELAHRCRILDSRLLLTLSK